MSSASNGQKLRRYLLPVAFICLLVVLVSFSGCMTKIPGLSGLSLPGFGSSNGTAEAPAAVTVPAQGTGTSEGSGTSTAQEGSGGGLKCPEGYESYTLCGQNCYNLTSNPYHCGSCDTACSLGQTCTGGKCSGGGGGTAQQSGSEEGGTAKQSGSEEGNTAQQSGSEEGGTAQQSGSCDEGTWCPNMCTNLQVDNRNCGSCGNICASNKACFNGVCTATSCANQAWSCSGHCALLMGDMPPLNCGGCGNACPSGQLCYSGICKDFPSQMTGGLPQGYHVCGKYFMCKTGNDDPCKEMDTTTTFCGYGKTLADGGTLPFLNCCSSGQTCVNGQCQGSKCGTGLTSCSGACVNTQTNKANCGACFNKCPSGQSCVSGKCIGYATCASGTTRCNDACVNTQTDAKNCGSCGKVCSSGICSAGVCVDCNTVGDCMAPNPPNMDWTACSNHKCVRTCNSGYGNCDGNIQNGCEANLLTGTSNCGTCGTTCPSGAACTGGSCHCPTGYYVFNNACMLKVVKQVTFVKPIITQIVVRPVVNLY